MQTPVVLGVYLTHLHLFLLNPGLSKNEIGGSRHVTRLPAPCAAPVPFAPIRRKWWAQMDLNHRPRAYQARALTN